MTTAKDLDRELARELAAAFASPLLREACEERVFEALQGRRIMGANDAKIVDKLYYPPRLVWWRLPPEERA